MDFLIGKGKLNQILNNKKNKIIVFDTECLLCNWAVLQILKYDKKKVFLFASFKSNFINDAEINNISSNSVVLINSGKIYT